MQTSFFSSLLILLFSINTGFAQTQIGQDLQGLSPDDWFGYSVAMSADGNRVAVSAPRLDAGYVTVFELEQGEWVQMGDTLEGKKDFASFGEAVALTGDGNRLVVTAVGTNNGCRPYIRTYDWDGSKWVQFNDDFTSLATIFSKAMTISKNGNILITGNEESNGFWGRVSFAELNGINNWFDRNGVNGPYDDAHLGSAVDVSADGKRVIIGAGDWNSNSDFAVIYQSDGDRSWDKIGEITSEDPNGEFGRAVSISDDGTRIAVGSPTNSDAARNAGSVRVYEYNFGRWEQIGNDLDGLTSFEHFGRTVDLNSNGKRLLVGADNKFTTNGDHTGSVYLFEERNGNWVQVGQEIIGQAESDKFGAALAISSDGERFIVGGFLNDDAGQSAGHAKVYDMRITSNNNSLEQVNQVKLFPNPTEGVLYLDNFTADQFDLIRIYDLTGKLVLRPTFQNNRINLSVLPTGVYVVQLISNENQSFSQLIKKR